MHTGDHGIHFCFNEGKIFFTLVSLHVSVVKQDFLYVVMGGFTHSFQYFSFVSLRSLAPNARQLWAPDTRLTHPFGEKYFIMLVFYKIIFITPVYCVLKISTKLI